MKWRSLVLSFSQSVMSCCGTRVGATRRSAQRLRGPSRRRPRSVQWGYKYQRQASGCARRRAVRLLPYTSHGAQSGRGRARAGARAAQHREVNLLPVQNEASASVHLPDQRVLDREKDKALLVLLEQRLRGVGGVDVELGGRHGCCCVIRLRASTGTGKVSTLVAHENYAGIGVGWGARLRPRDRLGSETGGSSSGGCSQAACRRSSPPGWQQRGRSGCATGCVAGRHLALRAGGTAATADSRAQIQLVAKGAVLSRVCAAVLGRKNTTRLPCSNARKHSCRPKRSSASSGGRATRRAAGGETDHGTADS